MEERALRYTDDLHRFNGDARAVYLPDEDDDGVREKRLSWRDERCRVDVASAKASWRAADTDDGVVDERFADVRDRGVREEREGDADLDAATEERLKDLGYM
jgi:hypothetical protein